MRQGSDHMMDDEQAFSCDFSLKADDNDDDSRVSKEAGEVLKINCEPPS